MLKHARRLTEARTERKGKRGLHWPDVGIGRWLSTGSEETEALSAAEPYHMQEEEDDDDEEEDNSPWKTSLVDPGTRDWSAIAKARESESRLGRERRKRIAMVRVEKKAMPWSLKLRGAVASCIDGMKHSDHVLYAFKFTFGVMLVTWPAFFDKWTLWYQNARAGGLILRTFGTDVLVTSWLTLLYSLGRHNLHIDVRERSWLNNMDDFPSSRGNRTG